MSPLDGSVRQRMPATALGPCEARHAALVSALRAQVAPRTVEPPLRALARAVVGEQTLDVYRSFQTP